MEREHKHSVNYLPFLSYKHFTQLITHLEYLCIVLRHIFIVSDKLAKGIPVTRILDDVRESSKPLTLQRIDLIGKRDILNIKRDCFLRSSKSESTSLCWLSPQLNSGAVNNDHDDIKSMIRAMIKLTKKSVLDSDKKESMKNILSQGMEVLLEGISKQTS